MTRNVLLDWPVRLVRPPEDWQDIERYDPVTGSFIPDDGKFGLAFSGRSSRGVPMWTGVEIPRDENMVCQWQTAGGVLHTETRNGKPEYGKNYDDWNRHTNVAAAVKAKDRTFQKWSCANGVPDESSYKRVGICAWCADNGRGHKLTEAYDATRQLSGELNLLIDEKKRLVQVDAMIVDLQRRLEDCWGLIRRLEEIP